MMLYTVGHSNHPIDKFLDLLTGNGISAVADVRSQPFSRRFPQFNKERLAASLSERGIAYVFLGKELGARSDDESCYEDGRVQYPRLAATPVQTGHRPRSNRRRKIPRGLDVRGEGTVGLPSHVARQPGAGATRRLDRTHPRRWQR
jgi:hypothetical protein